MQNVTFEIDYVLDEVFPGVTVTDGQDITDLFQWQIACPLKVVVVQAQGPGGGNPELSLTFSDEDHATEWWLENYDADDIDFLYELIG